LGHPQRGCATGDPFAKFFFCFAGLNALYFLWSKIDRPRSPDGTRPANEREELQHLVGKLDRTTAERVVRDVSEALDYFKDRAPIERMGRRKPSDGSRGEEREGEELRDVLRSAGDPGVRLTALAGIVYLIRSNLVHGSKLDSGDDEEVIGKANPVLRSFLQASVSLTEHEMTAR
jgi:hypothetical protein